MYLKSLSLSFLLSSVLATPTLVERADCRTQTVASGDGCGTLAQKCGISANDFTKYNPDKNLCSTLAVGQRVCCSSGSLPDIRPKKGSDGKCAAYSVKSGDTCSAIAAANGLKVEDLAKFNDGATRTWGWSGCKNLQAGLNICLSDGDVPLPGPIPNAVCGPTVPGTKYNASIIGPAFYNPCPLNACCNVWGQCGITDEFCTYKQAETGNPGTSPPGIYACVSNCDSSKPINNAVAPSQFISVGYFESWTYSRPCLNMRVRSIETDKYTHVHWAFGLISPDFAISINDTEKQWSDFKALQGAKKILSFGGWDFSTSPSTYNIFRTAVTAANREKFATNMANFIKQEGMDGVDIDWEYPGAPDIPGIPAGGKDDGQNYLAFLKLLRSKLGDKSISIAAPASYWYLKQFPISEISDVVDYIVYMTYDLHGQWDYGNKYAQEGCPNGDCLRSHANLTETMNSLTMITKAGVMSKKIVVGLPSYGRSFGMSKPGCIGPDCHYGGPKSTAKAGDCTLTSGILANAEIDDIIATARIKGDNSVNAWYDKGSNSNIMTYGNDQWVAYIDETTRASRTGFYKGMNFGGTIDWAMAMRYVHPADEGDLTGPDDDDDKDEWIPDAPVVNCDAQFNNLDDLGNAAGSIPEECKMLYTVQTLEKVYDASISKYQDLMKNNYDKKFQTYAKAVSDSADKSIKDFMDKHGNDYFTCIIPEATYCCKSCGSIGGRNSCAYCNQDECYHTIIARSEDEDFSYNNNTLFARDHPTSQRVPTVTYYNQSEPCPPDYSKRGAGPQDQSVYWSLRNDQADKFWADILTNTGIPKSKMDIGRVDHYTNCEGRHDPHDTCWNNGHDFGYPIPKGYGPADVTNPKDLVTKALSNSVDIHGQVKAAVLALHHNAYVVDASQLADAISIPILMVVDAVDNMQQVEDTAEKIDEAKKKALILAFLGALLFFIPIAGEVLGAATGIAEIATILTAISAVGDAAMGAYSIAEDPHNPLLGIVSIILAPLALTNLAKIGQASNLRRGMSDADIAKLGPKVTAGLGALKKITGVCRKSG